MLDRPRLVRVLRNLAALGKLERPARAGVRHTLVAAGDLELADLRAGLVRARAVDVLEEGAFGELSEAPGKEEKRSVGGRVRTKFGKSLTSNEPQSALAHTPFWRLTQTLIEGCGSENLFPAEL